MFSSNAANTAAMSPASKSAKSLPTIATFSALNRCRAVAGSRDDPEAFPRNSTTERSPAKPGSDAGGRDCRRHHVGRGFVIEALVREAAPGPEVESEADHGMKPFGAPAARDERSGQIAGEPRLHPIDVLLQEPIQLRHG